MAEPLKHIFSPTLYQHFVEQINTICTVDSHNFFNILFDSAWEQRSLKERLQHSAFVINSTLPGTYEEKIDILLHYIERYAHTANSDWMLGHMFIPQFVEMYGIHNYTKSIEAIECITQYSSCEFAIRPFILKYPQQTMQHMLAWASHPHSHVRRLASEGCRPRLPWAMQLPDFIDNPAPIIPILETLRCDDSLFVRKSVANNINDITKDNPTIALELCNTWKHTHANTDWIITHGLRTLLKQGNTRALQICNLFISHEIQCKNFHVLSPRVTPLQPLEFSFECSHAAPQPCIMRIEYCLYFLRSNGSYHKKVFRIKQQELAPHTTLAITKKHSFRPISTRTFYSGTHYVSIQINGQEFEKVEFEYEG